MDLDGPALSSSTAGAVEVSRWVQADARALLHRRHEGLHRDSGALDRSTDTELREALQASREQQEVDRRTRRAAGGPPQP